MTRSLYEILGTPVEGSHRMDPGTMITRAVETVDNDHAASAIDLLGSVTSNDGGPGTRITESIETVDDDHAAAHLALLSNGDPDPRPSPGTARTAAVETSDEDGVGMTLLLS